MYNLMYDDDKPGERKKRRAEDIKRAVMGRWGNVEEPEAPYGPTQAARKRALPEIQDATFKGEFKMPTQDDLMGMVLDVVTPLEGVAEKVASKVGGGLVQKVGAKLSQLKEKVADELPAINFRGGHTIEKADDPIVGEFLSNRAKSTRGAYLSPLEPNDLVGRRVHLSEDGTVGYVIDQSGDLQNVFNVGSTKGAGRAAVRDAVQRGATTLDAFDGFLPKLYEKEGFKETSRVPFNREYAPEGWNYAKDGEPDVVFMSRKGGGAKGRVFGEYDDAKKVQQAVGSAKTPEERAMALQGVISGRKGPATIIKPADAWKPTPRGVFDRSAPNLQGTMPSDPRLKVGEAAGSRMTTSPLVDAMADSKVIRQGLDADVAAGLHMGGPSWYELGPIKASLESIDGSIPFNEFNIVGGGASMNNSIPNELAGMSVINYARKRGLGLDEGKAAYRQAFGGKMPNPALFGEHMTQAQKGVNEGVLLPSDPASETWKIPSYANMRQGGGGELSLDVAGNAPALDTHERRRLLQLIMGDRQLANFAKDFGITAADDIVPLKNALDYRDVSQLYVDGAKRMGLPTAGAYQAGRWTGGWDKTGLKSPPQGDFVQLLEDALKYTAQMRGADDSPAGLRALWERVARGDDFIIPYAGKGGYPIK